jgi:hypothetical protein
MKGLKILAVLLLIAAVLLATGCERKIVNEAANSSSADQNLAGCFACHGELALNGAIMTAQGEWANSVHASGDRVDYTNRDAPNDCANCHDHQGFIAAIGQSDLEPAYEYPGAIHCFTCHAPHTNGDMRLRTTEAVTLLDGSTFDHGEGNLCAHCHHSRVVGTDITDNFNVSSSHWGPHHGPQGDVINGTGGYEYAGVNYTSSPHKSVVTNACVGCHMAQEEIMDGYKVGGHSWNMEDAETGTNMAAGLCGATDCHGSTVKDYDFTADMDYDGNGEIEGFQTEFDGIHEHLGELLVNAGVLTASGSPKTGVIADGGVAGALFNYLMTEEDRSHGVHNFNYERELLESSINYLESQAKQGDLVASSSHK